MSREKELAKNTIILSIGKFLPRVLTLVTLPILTGNLTKKEFGIYDLISTLIMLLIPISTLQIQSAAFRFLIDCRNKTNESKKIISNIVFVTLIGMCFVAIIIVSPILNYDFSIRVALAVYFICDGLYVTFSQISRGLGDNKAYTISSIVLSVVSCLGIVYVLCFWKQGLLGVIYIHALSNALASIVLLYKDKIYAYIHWAEVSKSTLKKLLSYSWPMVPNNLSSWILKLSDRLVITAVLGLEANAVYAAANKVPNLLSIAQTVLIMAWQENASIAVEDNDSSEYYSKMFDKIFSMVIGGTALLVGCTPFLFRILIKGQYEEAYYQMPLLILGMFFCCMSSFQGGIYIAHKKTFNVGVTTMIAAAVNLLIDVVLVNVLGITAGSISTLVAYFLLYIYRQIDVQKIQKIDFNVKKQILYIGLVILFLIICLLNNSIFNVINVFVSIIFCCSVNKESMKNILNKVVKR